MEKRGKEKRGYERREEMEGEERREMSARENQRVRGRTMDAVANGGVMNR